jgi:hypothetical protein
LTHYGSDFGLKRRMILKIIPIINIITPAIMNIEPFNVQDGLLYINELGGPNSDLDCAVKIRPAIISAIPIISIIIFMLYHILIQN